MAEIKLAQADLKPPDSPGGPTRPRINIMLMESAKRRRRRYSKTTCPRGNPGLPLHIMKLQTPLPPSGPSDPTDSGRESQFRRPMLPLWAKVVIMCVVVFFASIGYLRSNFQHAENVADIQDGPSDVPAPDKRKPVPDILLTADAGSN